VLVISHQVIEHLVAPSEFVREVARVTKHGKYALISTVLKGPLALGMNRNARGERVLAPDHLSEFRNLAEFLGLFYNSSLNLMFSITMPIAFPLKKFFPRPFVDKHRRVVEAMALPIPLYYRQVLGVFKKSREMR